MLKTTAHCNKCAGERDHETLHSDKTTWSDDRYGISGSDRYETLKCCGCSEIKLRHTSWFSEDEDTTVNSFPPSIFRPRPRWFKELWKVLPFDNDTVEPLLKEIYVAIQNNLPRTATMGVRALLESVMIEQVGDHNSFVKNMAKFQEGGFISRIQRERLETIFEAGHAAIHRSFCPTTEDLITLVDIAEHILETVYVHGDKVANLKKRIPAKQVKPQH